MVAAALIQSAELDDLFSYDGTSQYAAGGVSACPLASLNFARMVFAQEASGLQGVGLISELARRATIEVREYI